MLLGSGRGRRRRPGRPRGRSCSAPAKICLQRSRKRKQWSVESMSGTIEAVKNGSSIQKAAVEYGVPRQTLHGRISGRVKHGTNPGPQPYLSKAEEKDLADFLSETAKAGYGKSRQQVKGLATLAIRDKGLKPQSEKLSDGWYYRFMCRQSHLVLRKGDPIANVRMDCLRKDVMKDYFDKLKKTLEENDLMKNPTQIYNVDETGMPLDHHPPKVITVRRQKKVRSRTSGNKSQVTVIVCVSATGHALPPFVIFDAKSLNIEWTKGEVAGTRYGLSSTGWVDTELFKGWLVEHFLKFAVGGRPLLLILDGHSTHYQPELIKYAREHKIILFCLPPHTTHESQPLDASVFKPLKSHWHEACHSFIEKNPGKSVTKYKFSMLLNTAWGKAMSLSIISSGFRRSGIYPFNPDAIDYGMATDTDVEVNHNNEEESELCLSEQCDHEEQTLVDLSEQQFTHEQEELFNKRYDEKYDVPDPIYLKWLKINHPESHPDAQVCSTEQQFTPEQEELFNRRYEEKYDLSDPIYFEWLKINHPENHPDHSSLSDHFAIAADDIFLQDSDPLAEDNSLCLVNSGANTVRQTITSLPEEVREDEPTKVSQAASDTEASPSSSSEHASRYLEKGNSKEVSSSNDSCLGPSHVPSSTIAAVHSIPPPEHEGELNYISKYLVQYIPAKKAPPTGQRATTGARVLTSEECAQLIYERDEKKKKQLEEKEARKAERESKKKEKWQQK